MLRSCLICLEDGYKRIFCLFRITIEWKHFPITVFRKLLSYVFKYIIILTNTPFLILFPTKVRALVDFLVAESLLGSWIGRGIKISYCFSEHCHKNLIIWTDKIFLDYGRYLHSFWAIINLRSLLFIAWSLVLCFWCESDYWSETLHLPFEKIWAKRQSNPLLLFLSQYSIATSNEYPVERVQLYSWTRKVLISS